MLSTNELLRQLQEKKLCGKAVIYSETPTCTIVVCKRDENNMLLIAIATYNNYVYAKIVPEKAHQFEWNCSNIFHNPCGLYAFAENIEELVRKFKEKIALVDICCV